MMTLVSALEGQFTDIFAPGEYPQGKFTESDLQEIARNYDPSAHEAPAVVGHPEHDKPAYGWYDKLRVQGGKLQGALKQVCPQFEELVKKGRFKKRSVKLRRGPNGWELRHVGFLGAQAPAVAGLRDANFSDDDYTGEIEFSLQESDMDEKQQESMTAKIVEGIKNAFKSGKEEQPAPQFSEEKLQQMVSAAVETAVKPLAEKNDSLEKKFAEREKLHATESTKKTAEDAIGSLKQQGKYLNAFDKMGVPEIFSQLAAAGIEVEFGEGDKKAKKSGVQIFSEFLGALPKVVPAGDLTGGREAPKRDSSVQFTEGRAKADSNSVELTKLAKARASEKNITFGDALNQVSKEHPELTVPGNSSAGNV